MPTTRSCGCGNREGMPRVLHGWRQGHGGEETPIEPESLDKKEEE
jgi:hypothetical protein